LIGAIAAWQRRLEEYGLAPAAVVALRADYSLDATAALLAVFARRGVVALMPEGGDCDRYLQDCQASASLEIDADGRHDWRPRTGSAVHPLLRQLESNGDAGLVIFTSGSSGRPKAALQSVERFLHKYLRRGRQLRTLGFLLFDHVAGVDTLFYTLSNGGALIAPRQRDPASICALIERANVEVLPTSPSFLRLLCLAGNTGGHSLQSLQIITYGSEPMDQGTLLRVRERFPDVQLLQKYGTTESGSPRTESRADGSLWIRFRRDGVEARVVDGVLWLRGEGLILGYLNAELPVDPNGWYCTGDMVDVDGEWLHVRGRGAELINVGGEKVVPSEVEAVILGLDCVRSAAVSGEAHPLTGQIVTARVELSPGTDPKQATKLIRQRCREQLAAHKVPVKIDCIAGELVTARQKVQRLPATR
jgi:acyl-coenzyme A synthetase/AMP-(fatty) acid ligase